VGGKCLRSSRGAAWREIKASIVAPPRQVDILTLPAVSEPSLAWTLSGEADFQEREGHGPWVAHRIRKGSFFLTSGGAPYECRWKTTTAEPFATLLVFVELPLLRRAWEEVFGAGAPPPRLKDLSAFTDAALSTLMERLHDELMRRKASVLYVQGLGQAIAVHLARHYAETNAVSRRGSPALPGFKLQQITDRMARGLAEEFQLDRLAEQAGLSKFHFTRLFKTATGLAPSRYHLNLRMNAARRLLRETKKSIVGVALEVGYNNPSRFAQLFRRETGLTPSDYRRLR
jgi:AraC family transcriptional regulator